jgi:hypothetical protein
LGFVHLDLEGPPEVSGVYRCSEGEHHHRSRLSQATAYACSTACRKILKAMTNETKKPKLKQNKNEFGNPSCDPWDEAFIRSLLQPFWAG